nr:glutamine amidotransferase [Delftia sp. PS-11]
MHGQNCIAIVLAGNTYPHISESLNDFDQWISKGLGTSLPHRVFDAREEVLLPEPSQLAGVVVSGSHAMVTDREPWSERLAGWLRTCIESRLPVLGICYGHQLLAHAMGGLVAAHPEGLEAGTHTIELLAPAHHDPLFCTLPPVFDAQLVHFQSVRQLPSEAVLLARSAHEPHQAFRIGPCAWGVQFHPEFSAQAMQAYLDQMQIAAGQRALPTPEAARVLRAFAGFALHRQAELA